MADPKFRTEITADPAPYKAGMDAAAQIAQQTAQTMVASMAGAMRGVQASMQTGLSGIAGMFTKLNVVVAGAGALLATGGFAAGIRGAINLADELGKLSQKVGITVEELQFLKYAAELSDVSMEGMTKALKKLSTQMFEAGTGSKEARALFAGLGVEFESAPGKLRPTDEVLFNLADKFQKMEDGPAKAALAVKLFGREGMAMIPFLNQGREGLERMRGDFKSLAGTMDGEMAQAAERFNDNLKTLQLTSGRLGISMAKSILPVLNDITAAMTEAAKEGGILYTLWIGMGGVAANLFKGGSEEQKLAVVQKRIADLRTTMNTPGMPESTRMAWQRQMNALGAEELALVNAIVAKGGRLPFGDEPAAARKPKVQPDLDAFDTTTDKKTPSRVPVWEGALAAWRDAFAKLREEQGSSEELSLQQERSYWQSVLAIRNLTNEEKLAAERKLFAVEKEIRKDARDAQIADLKAQMESAETTAEERINLAGRVYQIEVDRHKAGSKEAIEALKAVQKEYDAWAKQRREILNLQADAEKSYQLSRVELERANLDTLEQLGIINAEQKLKRLRDLTEIEYTIKLAELEREKALMTQQDAKYQEQLNKIQALKEKNVADMAALDNKGAIEAKKTLDKWTDPIADGFQTMISGMIAGARKWTDVIRSTLVSVAQQYLATFARIGLNWVNTELLKTQATVASVAARSAAEATGATASAASTGTTAIANIGAKAWEAAASVYASIAQMGPVGAFMAPVMAAAAAATVLGFIGNIFKASGGFDIPAGINPITQLHGGEMVLPAGLAEGMRNIIAGGGAGAAGGGPDINVHFHGVHPDVRGWWRSNEQNIVSVLRHTARNNPGGWSR